MSKMASSNNKKRMIRGERNQESLSKGLGRWEDMNPDILTKIFSSVPISQLSRNVSLVCHSWQFVCWRKLFWENNVFDLRYIGDALGIANSTSENPFNSCDKIQNPSFTENYNYMAIKLMLLLKSILEDNDAHGICLKHWRLSIRTILIPQELEISDKHLLYLAERTTSVETLDLLGSSRITATGFAEAIRKWRNLNSINLRIGKVKKLYFIQIMEEIGKNCSLLNIVSLSMHHFQLTCEYASVIARNLVHIKVLRFEGVIIHRDGINRLLTHTRQVEEIQLCDCFLKSNDVSASSYSELLTVKFTFKRREWCFQNAEDVTWWKWWIRIRDVWIWIEDVSSLEPPFEPVPLYDWDLDDLLESELGFG